MGLNKYDELIEDTLKVKDDIDRRMYSTKSVDTGVVAAILVASQHSRENLSHSCEVIGNESNKRSMSVKTINNFTDKLGITLSERVSIESRFEPKTIS